MHDLLLRMSQIAARFRAAGAQRLSQAERDDLVLQSLTILEQGVATHRMQTPSPNVPIPKRPGRHKHTEATN